MYSGEAWGEEPGESPDNTLDREYVFGGGLGEEPKEAPDNTLDKEYVFRGGLGGGAQGVSRKYTRQRIGGA